MTYVVELNHILGPDIGKVDHETYDPKRQVSMLDPVKIQYPKWSCLDNGW
jgi:hypothetical protein